MNHDIGDTDFADVNGVRFERLRVAAAFSLIEALRCLPEPEWHFHREALRELVKGLELTPPEYAFATNGVFPRDVDIFQDAANITWGDVMTAIAQAEKTDARLEQMGL